MTSQCYPSNTNFSASDGKTMVFDWGHGEKLIVNDVCLIGWDSHVYDDSRVEQLFNGDRFVIPGIQRFEMNLRITGVPSFGVDIEFPRNIHQLSILEIMGFVNERIKKK